MCPSRFVISHLTRICDIHLVKALRQPLAHYLKQTVESLKNSVFRETCCSHDDPSLHRACEDCLVTLWTDLIAGASGDVKGITLYERQMHEIAASSVLACTSRKEDSGIF